MSSHMEDRVYSRLRNLNSEYKETMYDLFAYIKHLDGENEAGMECLGQGEIYRSQSMMIKQKLDVWSPGETMLESTITWAISQKLRLMLTR